MNPYNVVHHGGLMAKAAYDKQVYKICLPGHAKHQSLLNRRKIWDLIHSVYFFFIFCTVPFPLLSESLAQRLLFSH